MQACQYAVNAISGIVQDGDFEVSFLKTMSDEDESAAAGVTAGIGTGTSTPQQSNPATPPAKPPRGKSTSAAKRTVQEVSPAYKQQNLLQPWQTYLLHTRSRFAGRVKDDAIPSEAAAVGIAQEQLQMAVEGIWWKAEDFTQQHEMVTKLLPVADHPRFMVAVNSGPALWMQWQADIKVRLASCSVVQACVKHSLEGIGTLCSVLKRPFGHGPVQFSWVMLVCCSSHNMGRHCAYGFAGLPGCAHVLTFSVVHDVLHFNQVELNGWYCCCTGEAGMHAGRRPRLPSLPS
jgi:hypothetical protein